MVVGPEVVDGARGDGAVGVQQAHEGLGEHALARAGLAHDGEDLAVVDVEVDAADGVEDLSTQIEFDVEIPHREDQFVLFHPCASLLQMVLGVGGVREGVADQVKGDGDKA